MLWLGFKWHEDMGCTGKGKLGGEWWAGTGHRQLCKAIANGLLLRS